MGVSATGSRRWSIRSLKRFLTGSSLLLVGALYLYGPPVTPALHNAAADACNLHAKSNYRSYGLSWYVGLRPHWQCADASRPKAPALDYGWWVNPFS
jgi:hypothetical protein